jgi:hypothetical protein
VSQAKNQYEAVSKQIAQLGKNSELCRSRRDLGNLPVSSHWLYQRTRESENLFSIQPEFIILHRTLRCMDDHNYRNLISYSEQNECYIKESLKNCISKCIVFN